MSSFFEWASKGVLDYINTREKRVDAIGDIIKQGDKSKASNELNWAKKSIKRLYNDALGKPPKELENFANTPSDKNQRSQLKQSKYWLKVITNERDDAKAKKRFFALANKPYKPGEPRKVTEARNFLELTNLLDRNKDIVEYVEFDDED